MNYKTNKYSMMSSVILAAVQNARDKGRISGGIRFATNAYRGFGDKMAAYFDFNGTASYKDSAGSIALASPGSYPPGQTPTKRSFSYSSYASSSLNFVHHTPSGTFQYLRTYNSSTSNVIVLTPGGAVSMWIRVNPDATYDNLLLADSTIATFMYIPNSAAASNANQIVVSDKNIILTSTIPVTDGNWHNITWSSPSGGPEKLYIDGNLVDQEDISGSRGTRNFIYVGYNGYQDTATGGLSFQGDMDDFMMFQQDLAESEVKQIYAMGAPSHPVAKANTAK
jgi:hypothetical protein